MTDLASNVLFQLRISEDMSPIEINNMKQSNEDFINRLRAKLKVYLTLFQVLLAMKVVFNAQFSPKFSLFQVFQINIPVLLGLSCRFKYDYIDYLFGITLAPIGFVICLFVSQWIVVTYIHWYDDDDDPKLL